MGIFSTVLTLCLVSFVRSTFLPVNNTSRQPWNCVCPLKDIELDIGNLKRIVKSQGESVSDLKNKIENMEEELKNQSRLIRDLRRELDDKRKIERPIATTAKPTCPGCTSPSCNLEGAVTNVGLSSVGTTANCSTVYPKSFFACNRVNDGSFSTDWAPRGVLGEWVKLTFTKKRCVSHLRVKGRCYWNCQSGCNQGDAAKTATVEFDDSTTQMIPNIAVCPDTTTFYLSPRKLTSWIRVEVTSVHSTRRPAVSGFYEVEVWGT